MRRRTETQHPTLAKFETFDPAEWAGSCIHEQARNYQQAIRDELAHLDLIRNDTIAWIEATRQGHHARRTAIRIGCPRHPRIREANQ